MFAFSEIVGHEEIKSHLEEAIKKKNPFHAYIFDGDVGVGKETMAKTFAAGLLCQDSHGHDKPCKECISCRQVESMSSPDVIWVTRAKTDYGVDEIREQVIGTVDIRPYSAPYKVYIIPEAERLREESQNALLKTLEEPPEYAVFILLTSNISELLPTVLSRCLVMEFHPLSTGTVEEFLITQCQTPDYIAKESAAFAQGNIGKAIRYADASDEFVSRKNKILEVLKNVDRLDVVDMVESAMSLGAKKEELRDYIDLMMLWYRDVLIFKATKNINQLIFQNESQAIAYEAQHRSYEKIEEIIQGFDKAKVRIKANVNVEVTMELMFATMKE
ncbi:MAG TPA: DNA polymerase III subunit delta' [Lachnospiraceae bacterium]|nr:DNA polymerase III subunit delta' [Eubacterium sp.]HAK58216.1 DNA polymerase III subunit delta' [Lachnospiraceae bacterium]